MCISVGRPTTRIQIVRDAWLPYSLTGYAICLATPLSILTGSDTNELFEPISKMALTAKANFCRDLGQGLTLLNQLLGVANTHAFQKRMHVKAVPISGFPGMHLIGIDQNQTARRCIVFAALMGKGLITLFAHTDHIVIVSVPSIGLVNIKSVEQSQIKLGIMPAL